MSAYTIAYELSADGRPWVIRRADKTIVFRLYASDSKYAGQIMRRLNTPLTVAA